MQLQSVKSILPLVLLFSGVANAGDICVCPFPNCEVTNLQDALLDAAATDEDFTIRLHADTYSGNFSYDGLNGGNLTILGGYSGSTLANPCPDRTLDPANTTLDGQASTTSMTTLTVTNMLSDTLRLEGLTITRGQGDAFGAGLTVQGNGTTVVRLDKVIVSDNITDPGSPFDAETAGGVYVTGADVTVENSTFLDNTGGGAGGLHVRESDSTLLENNVFLNNHGSNGGGFAIVNSNNVGNGVTVVRNTFDSNTADTNAGMWAMSNAPIVMTDNVFLNNTSDTTAMGTGDPTSGGGLGISLTGNAGSLIFTNNTLSGNTSDIGTGGLYLQLEGNAAAGVYNSILYGNVSEESDQDFFIENIAGGTMELFNNGFAELGWGSTAGPTSSGDNLFLDGMELNTIFVDPPTDLHLVADAVVIDMGDNEAPERSLNDRDYRPRGLCNIVDMGAYEFYSGDADYDCVPNISDNCTFVANTDQRDTDADAIGNACDPDVASPNDCLINFTDLLVYRLNFFQAGDLDTDNNGDGLTNFLDLSVIVNFMFQQPGPSANGCN